VSTGRFLLIGLLAAGVAVAANIIAYFLLSAIFSVTPGFLPWDIPPIAIFTTLGMIGAVIAFALVVRWSKQPSRTYTWVALVALVLSIIPNILFAIDPSGGPTNPAAPVLGATLDWMLLIVLHIIPAAIAIWMLPRFGLEDRAVR
jgi:hypothetical protein